MVFDKFVEVGRVIFINYGPDYGKLAVILDVVDQNRALIAGPNVQRQQLVFKRVALTPLKLNIPRSIRQGTLLKAWASADVDAKWAETSFAKKIAKQEKRHSLTDLGRFEAMIHRKQKSFLVNKEVAKLKKVAAQ
ncbi:Large ribosomal subunit protein eL14 domain-containing protein [Plasmodiophora brassicae]|uniref:Large ribosomal subunit protein eL14 domain-containing protein n=1 Tax=Plasmodiophora brassicae TaxID=37360 RepID=A0A0G4IUY1_PLABS|nr:hypothetical protein PBRA_007068 [Plasmodiophora brassicae]SPQ95727.1 unnamed protein product [Plasmodiophora brassicae]